MIRAISSTALSAFEMRLRTVVLSILFTVIVIPMASQTSPTYSLPAPNLNTASQLGSVDNKGIDAIDLSTLDVTLNIPIYSKPGRKLSTEVSLQHTNQVWAMPYWNSILSNPNLTIGFFYWYAPNPYGWSVAVKHLGYLSVTLVPTPCDSHSHELDYTHYVYISPDGLSHDYGNGQLQNLTAAPQYTRNPCNNTSGLDYSISGVPATVDGYTLNIDSTGTATIATPSGTVITPAVDLQASTAPGTIVKSTQDSNGNVLTAGVPSTNALNQESPLVATVKDTLGVNTLTSTAGPTLSYSGPSVITESYIDSNGNTQTITEHYSLFSLQTNFGCPSAPDPLSSIDYSPTVVSSGVGGPVPLLDRVTLTNGTYYAFTYEPVNITAEWTPTTGRVASITLPTGGTISYTYGATDCLDGNPLSISRSDGNGLWQYSRTAGDSVYIQNNVAGVLEANATVAGVTATTVIDPLNNTTQLTFSGRQTVFPNWAPPTVYGIMPGIETDRKIFQGAATGVPIYEKQTCYNGFAPPCINQTAAPATYYGGPNESTSPLQIDTYESFNGAASKRTTRIYDPIARLLEQDNYDFGATTATSKRFLSYVNPGNTWVKEDKTTDGSGRSVLSDTTYGYDETAVVATSGVPQHVAVTGGRGNVTSVGRLLNGVSLTTTYTYDDTGNVRSVTDPCGNGTCADMTGTSHTSNYSYTDTWAANSSLCPVSGESLAFATSVTDALGHTTTASYEPCAGQTMSTLDANDIANSRKGTQYTYDSINHLTATVYPDGGSTSINYHKYALPLTITKTVVASPSPSIGASIQYDGLGRPVINTGANGAITTTVYDPSGNVEFVSNPHYSQSASTDGTTSYSYDALGRKLLQCQPDNGNGSSPCVAGSSYERWSYSGNTVTFTDELGNQWQRTSDGLGRLTKVLEPNGLSQAPNMETDYAYDAVGDLLSLTQNGVAGNTARFRSFTYDTLSRLVCASNPENSSAPCPTGATGAYVAGTVGYNYDLNGNVQAKTDARNITTTYAYDALNRLLSKSYSDGNTPSSCFQYDSATSNGVGQLASEWTQRSAAGSCPATAPTAGFLTMRSLLAYDPMGRIWSEQQCTPAGCTSAIPCSTSNGNQSYSYDLAGNLTCSSNGIASTPGVGSAPLTFTQSFDTAGRMSTLVSNWTSFPTNLFTIGQNGYNPAGGLQSWTQGPNLSVTQGYTNRFWISSISATGQVP